MRVTPWMPNKANTKMTMYIWSLLWKLLRGRHWRCYRPLNQNPEEHKGTIMLLLPPSRLLTSLSDNHHTSGGAYLVALAPPVNNPPHPQPRRFFSSRFQIWDSLMTTPINLCNPLLSIPYNVSMRTYLPSSPKPVSYHPYSLRVSGQDKDDN